CAQLRIQRGGAQHDDSGERLDFLHHFVPSLPRSGPSGDFYRGSDPDRGNGTGERRRIDHRSNGREDTRQPLVNANMPVTTYRRRRSSAGFTMVELLVTVAIATIL